MRLEKPLEPSEPEILRETSCHKRTLGEIVTEEIQILVMIPVVSGIVMTILHFLMPDVLTPKGTEKK